MHDSTRRLGALLAALVLALGVAACSGTASGAAGDPAPSISIAVPADGAQVSVPFDVKLDSSVPLGAPESGDHHAHLYFDSDPGGADYDILYGDTWQVTRALAPGRHTLTVALANSDHSLAGPTATINVTVAGQGAGGGGGAPAASPPAGSPTTPGYSY